MKLLDKMPCRRMVTRYLTSRCRPLTLLLTCLGLWLLLSVFYFYRPSSSESARDSSAAAVYQMQVGHVDPVDTFPVAAPVNRPQPPDSSQPSKADKPVEETKSSSWDAEFEAEEKEFEERRKRYENSCKAGYSGPINDIYYYEPAKLAVCHVPKVGCTFWKRVFHFLYNDTDGRTISSPFEIDRFYVHFGGGKKRTKTANYNTMKATLDSFNKVLFTRDPWARIWSGYIDKFVLPDSWLDHGRSIVSRRKDKHKRKACADNIEFVEYLDYVLNANRNVHWRPVHKVCNPCAFHPQYLGKMETFSRDSAHILRKVGLEKLVEGHDHAHYAEDEVRILTEYHFRLYETRFGLRKCLTHSGVAGRLWRAFTLNGYIGERVKFPSYLFAEALDGLKDTRQAGKKAVEMLLSYHRNTTSMTSKEMKAYRRKVMADNYRKAPRELLDKMVNLFNGDFDLFNYEVRPADIFASES